MRHLPFFQKSPMCACSPAATGRNSPQPSLDFKRIAGGLLVQEADRDTLMLSDLKVVSQRVPDAAELHDLLFAWHVAMFVKSNAIVYARERPHDRHRRRPDEPRDQREDRRAQGGRSQSRQ